MCIRDRRNIGPVHCGQLIPFLGIGRGYWRVLVGGSQDALHADHVFIRDGQAQAHVAGDLLCIGDASRRRAVSGEQRIRCACRTALPVDGDDISIYIGRAAQFLKSIEPTGQEIHAFGLPRPPVN